MPRRLTTVRRLQEGYREANDRIRATLEQLRREPTNEELRLALAEARARKEQCRRTLQAWDRKTWLDATTETPFGRTPRKTSGRTPESEGFPGKR